MRYLRLFSVSLLLTFVITGCSRRRVREIPPPQAEAPIVSTLPPMPPLTFPDVQLATSVPPPPAAKPVPQPKPPVKHTARKRHRRTAVRKPESDTTETPSQASGSANPAGTPGSASVLGQLSADEATASPDEKAATQRLIASTQKRLKKLSPTQLARHKDDVAQVDAFLNQAQQAWNMNDLVGARTLANKAKILMDDLLK